MRKVSCCILAALLLFCCVSCKKPHKDPGPGKNYDDKNHLFLQDGRILMSEDPYFILYLGEDSSEQETAIQGVFEDENEEIKHFYYSDISQSRSHRCAIRKIPDKNSFIPDPLDKDSYFSAKYINKTDRTTLIIEHSAIDKFQKGDKIVLRKIKMEYPETAEFLEKAKTLPKEQMPEVTIDKNPAYKTSSTFSIESPPYIENPY